MQSLSYVESTFDWGGRKWRWLGTGIKVGDWRATAIQVSWKNPGLNANIGAVVLHTKYVAESVKVKIA